MKKVVRRTAKCKRGEWSTEVKVVKREKETTLSVQCIEMHGESFFCLFPHMLKLLLWVRATAAAPLLPAVCNGSAVLPHWVGREASLLGARSR